MTEKKTRRFLLKMLTAGAVLATATIVSPLSSPFAAQPVAYAADAGACEATDVQINWGTIERWRSYVGGSIAKGAWETKGDVTYEIPEFVWTGGSGNVAEDGSAGEFSNGGSVDFRGHNDLLQVEISNPSFEFEGDKATLKLDYTATDMEGAEAANVKQAEAATFDIADGVTLGDGYVVIAGNNGVLTAEGVDAFGGFYDEGEPVDDITVKATLDCAGTTGGNAGGPDEQSGETGESDDSAAEETPSENGTFDGPATAEPEGGFPVIPVAIGGAVVVVALGAGAIVANARKRKADQ